jgi:chemotaxis protein MotB
MPKRRKNSEDENLERWLLTYADLITLLLAFFIVMYSMSKIDAKRFGQMQEALSGVLRGGTMVLKQGDKPGTLSGKGVLKIGFMKSLGDAIKRDFQGLGNEKLVSTEVTERGLVIHIMESALFEEGKSDLTENAREVLTVVGEHLDGLPNHIRIEGHTDNRPINTIRYPSNWELSSARATEVVKFLIDNYDTKPDMISALGYGEFRPLAPNSSDETRARNRRVDIVVLTMKLTEVEPTAQYYTKY